MTKYQIKVEIPDGKYCVNREEDVFCDYIGVAYYGAGRCRLIIKQGDNIVHYEGDKFNCIPKSPECPSLKEVQ